MIPLGWVCHIGGVVLARRDVSRRKVTLPLHQRARQGVFFSQLMRRGFCVALIAGALIGLDLIAVSRPAFAEGPRHAAMIVDGNTGKVLHDVNGASRDTRPRSPSS